MHKSIHHENIVNTSFCIPQYDGHDHSLNDSLTSHLSEVIDSSSYPAHELSWFSQEESSIPQEDLDNLPIPVHIGYRDVGYNSRSGRKPGNNITIRRDNRMIEAVSLPVFSAIYLVQAIQPCGRYGGEANRPFDII